jgi:hypothetical protein
MNAKDYRRPEGVIALPRAMIRSPAYRALSLPARALIVELQHRWAPDRGAINYSVRDAASALGIGKTQGAAALAELKAAGFIRLASESNFIGRKARGWLLTWNVINGHEPADDWRLHGNPPSAPADTKPICVPVAGHKTKPLSSARPKGLG